MEDAPHQGHGPFSRTIDWLFPEARQLERRRRVGYAVLVLLAGALAIGVFIATDPARRVLPTTPGARPSDVVSVELAGTYRVTPDLMAATAGHFFGGSLNETTKRFTVLRINSDGSVMRRALANRRAWWFSQIAVAGPDLFIATNVDRRFTTATNELVRLSTSTLRDTGRMTLPGGALATAAAHRSVWVATSDRIMRINAHTLSIDASSTLTGATGSPTGSIGVESLALGPGGLWATYGGPAHTWLYRMNPDTLKVTGRVRIPDRKQGARVVAGPKATWLTGSNFARPVTPTGHLGKPTHATGLQAAAVKGRNLLELTYTGSPDETLTQLAPSGHIITRSRVGDAGAMIAINGRIVWLLHGLRLAHWVLEQR